MSDLYIDKKYVSLLSPVLKHFKQRGEFLWNYRCPLCGDSQKDTTKARGYIFLKKGELHTYCHNCGEHPRFDKFLKRLSPSLYREYVLEKFARPQKQEETKAEEFVSKPVFKAKIDLPSIASLKETNPVRQYITQRQIPRDRWNDLYYAEDFSSFVEELHPTYDKRLYKEPRLVIPFYDRDKNLLGFQGRALAESKVRYITIKLDEDNEKVYGWDRVDLSKRIYVTEGPIDSMFLDNAIASMDAALYHVSSTLGIDKDYVFVYDNEPRNNQIVSNMRKTIGLGYKVCVWPEHITFKDINEGVLQGLSPAQIQHIIDTNTYEGLKATMMLNIWSKT